MISSIVLNLHKLCLTYCRGPPSEQVLQLMRTFLAWTKKPIDNKNCLILNFGVPNLQFPTLR